VTLTWLRGGPQSVAEASVAWLREGPQLIAEVLMTLVE
jgi:hypothetical protein